MRARGLLLLTLCSAAALAVLIGLGVWQLQRLQWKEGLIAEIEARSHAEPISLKEAVTREQTGEDVSYVRVRVDGKFDNGKERYLFAVSDGAPGWHVITPLTTSGGDRVLIDRGFVPDAFKDPASRPQGELTDAVTVTALARPSETQGVFIPNNEPERNRWFWRDLARHGEIDVRIERPCCGTFFPRGGAERHPRRLASGRPDQARSPQQPFAICHHLVRARVLPCGHLCHLCPEQAKGGVIPR